VFTAYEYKKEIQKYLEKFDTEEQTLQTRRTHIKLSIDKAAQNTLEFYSKKEINE
jgi:hypothetical protein